MCALQMVRSCIEQLYCKRFYCRIAVSHFTSTDAIGVMTMVVVANHVNYSTDEIACCLQEHSSYRLNIYPISNNATVACQFTVQRHTICVVDFLSNFGCPLTINRSAYQSMALKRGLFIYFIPFSVMTISIQSHFFLNNVEFSITVHTGVQTQMVGGWFGDAIVI